MDRTDSNRKSVRRVREWIRTVTALSVTAALVTAGLAACQPGEQPGGGATSGLPRGEQVYMNYCQSCHPGGNFGAGPAIRPVLPSRTDDELIEVIRKGKNRMPGFTQTEIPDDDLKLLVEYMRGW